jgi:hypothetical protein
METTRPKENLTFTVGISTRAGGPGLIPAVKSILNSEGVPKFRFIVVAADSLAQNEAEELRYLGVELVENNKPGSLPSNIKKKLSMCQTDIIILTHDDIKFEPNTLKEIIETLNNYPDLTMAYVNVKALPAKSFFEAIIAAGMHLSYRIGILWRGGDNYMLANGQCMVFRTEHLRKMNIPEKVANLDIFFYFENKRIKGQFRHIPSAVIYKRCPRKLNEHLNQSSRFQHSRLEMSRALNMDLSEEYNIPSSVLIKALLKEFLHDPIHIFFFVWVCLYTRLFRREYFEVVDPLWQVDKSTKEIV